MELDLAINDGSVIDTEKRRRRPLNVGIRGDKIVAVTAQKLKAKRVIDACGLIVSPGFIDVHAHLDGDAYGGELAACQGITTSIGGNCGLSPIEMEDFFQAQERDGYPIHQAEYVGHSFSLRREAGLKNPYVPASPEQIARMECLAQKALEEGACGISFGLDYSPGASLEEIRALAALCAAKDRVMPVHTRLFTRYDLDSLTEILSIARDTGVRLLFSHFVYQYGEGDLDSALEIVDKARDAGLDIHIDSGMYTDWATYIHTATYDLQTIHDNGMHFHDMMVATGPYIGQRLDFELYPKIRNEYPDESIIYCNHLKDEAHRTLRCPYAMPSTDMGAYSPGEGHPQIAGTFPKFIKDMVRIRGELSLEEALSKATLLPARLFAIPGKGKIEEGFDADLTVFDFDRLSDLAVYPDQGRPDAKPVGIEYVMVAGNLVVDQGIYQNSQRPGRVIRYMR